MYVCMYVIFCQRLTSCIFLNLFPPNFLRHKVFHWTQSLLILLGWPAFDLLDLPISTSLVLGLQMCWIYRCAGITDVLHLLLYVGSEDSGSWQYPAAWPISKSLFKPFLKFNDTLVLTLFLNFFMSWTWWHKPLILALRWQSQANLYKFKASLVYIGNSRSARAK